LLEGITAVLFLLRRPTLRLTNRPVAWIAAPVGSFAMLFARPSGFGGPHFACETIQIVGAICACLSVGTLGRSFGLVAADRGLKMHGPYSLVRHPAYAAYLLCWTGYLAENVSVLNACCFGLATASQLVRIWEEERVLASDARYVQYCSRVRYRLLPLLY
jgi:protein-S-isoprenylcysteine O-methyltransferase Ste14